MIDYLFMIAVCFLPFSDFKGLPFLGEVQHDLGAHIMLLALAAGLTAVYIRQTTHMRRGPREMASPGATMLFRIAMIFAVAVIASFVANFETISMTAGSNRNGVGKLIASSVMLVVGFGFAWLALVLGRRQDWQELVIRPVGISIVICAVFAVLEGMSFYFGGGMASLQQLVSEITHSGSRGQLGQGGFFGGSFGWYDDAAGKTRSVSFEAPAFADFLGMAWPWIYAGTLVGTEKRRRIYFCLSLIVFVLMYFSGARTAWVFMAANISILLLLKHIYLSPNPRMQRFSQLTTLAVTGALSLGIFFYIYRYGDVAAAVAAGDMMNGRDISNVSRLAMMTSGWGMFTSHPVLGVGFGQYGFRVLEYMPSWGWRSWEIQQWFTGEANVWPSTFSCFVRFASEMGIVGLMLWSGLWIYLATCVCRVTALYQRITGDTLMMAYPLIMGCFAVLVHGIASDALRSPIIWMTLGLSCAFIAEGRRLIAGLIIYTQMHDEENQPDELPEAVAIADKSAGDFA